MTILTLDRLYSLKAALSAYSKFRSPLRLEDAVDELRRLILTNNGRKVTKADLLRSYDWLSVSHSAVTDLDRMYKRAYGGPEEIGAISGMSVTRTQLVPEPVIRSEDEPGDEGPEEYTIGIALTTQESPKLLVPKAPVLKLQTSFDSPPKKQEDAGDEDGDRTAKPSDWLPIMLQPWNASSIDEVLSPGPGPSPARLGPRTPNGYDDISPTTRGEWGFLMVDDAFQGAKTVTVETC